MRLYCDTPYCIHIYTADVLLKPLSNPIASILLLYCLQYRACDPCFPLVEQVSSSNQAQRLARLRFSALHLLNKQHSPSKENEKHMEGLKKGESCVQDNHLHRASINHQP